ncbi:Peptidase M23 [Oxalobacteraceae bacterium]
MLHDKSVHLGKVISFLSRVSLMFVTLTILGCASIPQVPSNFIRVIGASRDSDVRPCTDYASPRNYMGEPYYIKVPETGRVITRHEGVDFCGKSGSDVLAPASGTVVNIIEDNPYRGGSVTLQTSIRYDHYATGHAVFNLYLQTDHIIPNKDLKVGSKVNAGDVIGRIQPANRPEIYKLPHVHLEAGAAPDVWNAHTDPNQFWQKGPGKVSCYDPANPPSDQQIVAPIRCSVADKK